jgi:hypothetical protein
VTFGDTPADKVTLSGAAVEIKTTANDGNLTFNSKVDGAQDLTLATNGTGTITFQSAVGSGANLASITTTIGKTVIAGGSVETQGAQTYNDAVTLQQNTVLTSTANGNVTFNSTVDAAAAGGQSLTVNTGGTTTFGNNAGDDRVGTTNALSSLTTDAGGSTVFNVAAANTPSVTTSGAQTYNDAVTLQQNTVLTSTASGNVTFNSTVDAVAAGGQSLTVNTGGTTTFGDNAGDDRVGATNALSSLTTDAGGSTVFNIDPASVAFNADPEVVPAVNGSVRTTGAQTYSDDVRIDRDTKLVTTNSDVTFAGSLNSEANEANAIRLNVGSGTVTLTGAVGGAVNGKLGDIRVDASDSFRSLSTIGMADGRTLRLRSNDVQIDGTVLTPGGTIDIASRTDGRSVSLGSEVAGQLSLDSAEIARLDTRAGAGGDGLVRITTRGTGDIGLANNVILPGGALSIVSARNVASTATVETSGRVLIEAAGATGTLTVTSGSVTSKGTDISTLVGNKTFSIAEPATGLDVGADLRSRAGLVVLRGNGDVTLKTATANAEVLAVQSGATLSLGTVTATAGTAVTFTAPTSVLATGVTRVLPRAAGREPAVVYDTRLARPADPLALIVADTKGLAPASQITQIRAGNGAGAFADAPNAAAGALSVQLDAGNSAAFLLVGNAAVTGTINAGRLGVHGAGGTMTLTGTLAGKAGEGAAPLADITRPVTTNVQQKYKINDCTIATVTCVVAPTIQMSPPRPVEQIVLQVQGNRINPAEVVIPNASEAETE